MQRTVRNQRKFSRIIMQYAIGANESNKSLRCSCALHDGINARGIKWPQSPVNYRVYCSLNLTRFLSFRESKRGENCHAMPSYWFQQETRGVPARAIHKYIKTFPRGSERKKKKEKKSLVDCKPRNNLVIGYLSYGYICAHQTRASLDSTLVFARIITLL